MANQTIIDYTGISHKRHPPVNYNNAVKRLQRMERKYENIELSVIGHSDGLVFDRLESITTYVGPMYNIGPREIYALDIHPWIQRKGLIFIVAGHHSVEPAGPAAALEFGERLLRSESAIAQILKDNFQITIVPMVDVDYFS